jgi:hypothetical protein
VNPVIEQFRTALAGWMTADERARLDAVDVRDTWTGEPHALRWLAADRALRQFAPMALDGIVRSRDAARLRSLPAVTDARGAAAVARERVIAAAVRRRARVDVETADRFALRIATWGIDPPAESGWRADERALAADRAVIAAADCAMRDDVAEAANAAQEAAAVLGDGDERARVVDAAIDLVRDMAFAARAVRIPDDFDVPIHVAAFDPFELPTVVPARPERHPVRRRAHAVPARPSFEACIDDLSCLPP